MQKIYSLLLLFTATCISLITDAQGQGGASQCAITKIGLEVLKMTPDNTNGCVSKANVFFVANVKNNNLKYFTAHVWDRARYPNLPLAAGSDAPSAASLGRVLRTIVIERENGAAKGWKLSSAYPDKSVNVDHSGITLKSYTVQPNAGGLYDGFKDYVFFELSGISVTSEVACSNVDLAVDIWGSTKQENTEVVCANKTLTIFSCKPAGIPSITGTVACVNPRAYSMSFNNAGGCYPYFINYTVYADANNDGRKDDSDPVMNSGDADNDGEKDNYAVVFPGESVVTSLRPLPTLQQRKLFVTSTVYTFSSGGVQAIPYEQLVIDNSCISLPVKIVNFSAARKSPTHKQIELEWLTEQEQDNKGFSVQRKTSGEWETLDFVASKAPHGNSNTAITYSSKDQNTYTGTSQYRLQQEYHDGKTSYSNVITVPGIEKEKEVNLVTKTILFPNPAIGGKVSLMFPSTDSREVIISNLHGQIVKHYQKFSLSTLTIPGLHNGFYIIKITNLTNGDVVTEKVVVK